MTVHVVLFRPRAGLSIEDRDALLDAMRRAARRIESVRGFRIGSHVQDAPTYAIGSFPVFPYMALIEFDDEAGLRAYLDHPAHLELAERFTEAAEAAYIYDFTITGELR